MKFFKLTVSYLTKRKVFLLFSVIAGALLGVVRSGGGFFNFLANFFEHGKLSFYDVYRQISPVIASWWGTALFVILLSMFFAYVVGVIDRHMKIGQFNLGSPFRRVNENLIFVLTFIVTLLIVEEVVNVAVSLMSSMLLNVAHPTVAYLLTIASYVVFQSIAIIVLSMSALWIPETLHSGLSVRKAYGSSIELAKGNIGRMFVGILAVLLPCFLVSILGAFLPPSLQTVVNVIVLSAIVAYLPTFMFVCYYEIADLEREDLNPTKNLWKR